MSPSGRSIQGLLSRAVGRLRAEGALAVAIAVMALVPAGLILAWVVGGWGPRGAGPLALWSVGVAAGLGLLALLGRRWVGGVDETSVAAAAERARRLPEGSLRGVLELGRELPAGASGALFRRSESQLAGRIAGASPAELGGDLGVAARERRRRLLTAAAGLVLVVAAVGFASPARARSAWAPLLDPVNHLRGPVLPVLVVAPGDTAVDRGRPLDVRIEAPLRTRVTLHWRTPGDVPRERTLPLKEGRAGSAVGPVDAELSYWVQAPDGAVSDTFTVTPRDPLLLTRLTVELSYPPHVDREPDHYRGDPPLLRVPEGTRLSVAGQTSGALSTAGLRHESGAERPGVVDEDGFQLDWTLDPAASGRWDWALVGADGDSAMAPSPMEVRVVEDAPPEVRITVPGADTLMPASLQQPILAQARDDYGLAAASLVFRRVDSGGERSPPITAELSMAATAGHATLRGVLDAAGQPLVPGDAIEYHVVVRDNSPAGQSGRSATYLLRLPSMSELRDRARRESGELLDAAGRMAERARELESRTRDLSRSAGNRGRAGESGGEPGRASPPAQVGFEDASEARDLAGEHEDVLSSVDELRARMDELQQAMDEAGLRDPELQRRMIELRELAERLATPELREQVEALQQAAESLDPEAVQEALDRLAERQEEFRRQIEQSLEMMRRAAAEQEMNALAREAEEIAARQEALAEAMQDDIPEPAGDSGRPTADRETNPDAPADPAGDPRAADPSDPGTAADPAGVSDPAAASDPAAGSEAAADSAGDQGRMGESPSLRAMTPEARAEQQEELGEEAQELGQSLQQLQQQLQQMGEQESASQAGAAREQGKAAQESMEQAAEEARGGRGAQASASGKRAASQMSDAARTLDEARQQMAEARQREAREAVQDATQEALSMAQRQESLRQEMEDAQGQGGAPGESLQQMRSDQAALQQGLRQLGRNLQEAGERSARIDPQVARALERAGLNMDRTLEGLQEGGSMPVRQAEQSVEALNQLAMSLLENDGALQRSQSPGALQQALRELGQAAQEQGSLNGRASALVPMQLAERALTRQLQQVAEQQRAVARRIGDVSGMVGGREDVLGQLDQLSTEAARIARDLEGGRLDPEVMARQDRLFHRLLDAGRSLEREEYSDERVGGAPAPTEVPAPDALDPALLDPAVLYPTPTAEQLDRLPPAYRRLILEYFDRLNRGGGGG